MGRQIKRLEIGSRFNNWEVIDEGEIVRESRGNTMKYKVRCDCGFETKKTTNHLRSVVNNYRFHCERCKSDDKEDPATIVERQPWERTSVPAPLVGGKLAAAFIGGL